MKLTLTREESIKMFFGDEKYYAFYNFVSLIDEEDTRFVLNIKNDHLNGCDEECEATYFIEIQDDEIVKLVRNGYELDSELKVYYIERLKKDVCYSLYKVRCGRYPIFEVYKVEIERI